MFYHSGVYFEPNCGNTDADLDHEVLAIGFGTDPFVCFCYTCDVERPHTAMMQGGDYWIVKNSWSQYWGDEGYVLMSRLNNNCGACAHDDTVTVGDGWLQVSPRMPTTRSCRCNLI